MLLDYSQFTSQSGTESRAFQACNRGCGIDTFRTMIGAISVRMTSVAASIGGYSRYMCVLGAVAHVVD